MKRWLIEKLPVPLRPAARYWYRAITSRLDIELSLLQPLLQPGTVAIDVGANLGDYTYFFLRHGLRVEAFEPNPECAESLETMAAPALTVHPEALSDQARDAQLLVPVREGILETARARLGSAGETASSCRAISVHCETLDSYSFDDVSVLKIDVEGHELAVLGGAGITVKRNRPIVIIELERRHLGEGGLRQALDWFAQNQYQGFFAPRRGMVLPLNRFSVNSYQRLAGDTPVAPYVNNFIFLPSDRPNHLNVARRFWPLAS